MKVEMTFARDLPNIEIKDPARFDDIDQFTQLPKGAGMISFRGKDFLMISGRPEVVDEIERYCKVNGISYSVNYETK